MTRKGKLSVLGALVACLVAAGLAGAAGKTGAGSSTAAVTGCQLGDKAKVKHVIYIQFDNVHAFRDNPNVPSDLEQMPHLKSFLENNGTLDTQDHTVLISHTGGGVLSSLTGLYPDRHGQAVSNAYGYFAPSNATAGVNFSSSFKYWTDNTDGGNPANNPPTPSADTNFNMVNNDPAALGGTGATRNAPAPCVPYTRAGCDVGGVGLANIELENNTAIINRSTGNTTLAAAASAVGDTNIKVASVTNLAVGQKIVLETGTVRAEIATITTVGTPGAGGTGVGVSPALAKVHQSGGAVTVYSTDPTGDMTKVFGANSPEWIEGRDSQIAPSNTGARALAQTDFVGIAIHCATGGGICARRANATNARPDALPDEMGGYNGFKGLFGSKYVNPAIAGGATCVNDTSATPGHPSPIVDPFGQCGFPGFDGMTAKDSLGITAAMQESGVPVTFTYVSDAHDNHGISGNIHVAYGPGDAGYVQQLKDYDASFETFFNRLKSDGITKDNSLFVVTVEEGDHFAGTAPDTACDGVTTPCTYANGHVTEANGDLRRIIAKYNADHGTNATTQFSVHADMAPNVYIKDNPARDSATTRNLEKAMSDINVTNPLSGENQSLFVAMADPVEQKLLHMETADPLRMPSFTPFAQGDYFLNASPLTNPPTNPVPCDDADPVVTNHCVFLPVITPVSTQTFAWNHGGVQSEVASTWVGFVGPGIEKKAKLDDDFFSDHTDLRPTMLSLLGLKDSYVSDGRVLTEILKGNAQPKGLHGKTAEDLGQAYKQINASFGQFSMDTLTASTAALASNNSGDTTYTDTEAALQDLGADRDALAGQMRMALWNAEFNGQKLDEKQAKDWIKQANDLLDRAASLSASSNSSSDQKELKKVKHIVVVYEENHSFDNLYGGWEGVNGRANADTAHTTQVNQAGNAYACLKQDDVNLTSPPVLPASCSDSTTGNTGGAFMSAFTNAPFLIDTYIPPTATTCPSPLVFGPANGILNGSGLPGGCTRDLVHRYYQEPYQLNGGAQNRYMTGSDAIGLTMGYYDTTTLRIYTYLHDKKHPDYVIADNFFQGSFGGSYLNHQWLIAAATPTWSGALNDGSADDLHSGLDANGMPNNYPLYASPLGSSVKDQQLTQSCSPAASRPPLQPAFVCGNYTVNTTQPFNQPYSPGTAVSRRLPPLPSSNVTIGDELSAANVDWAWYAGGWDNASGNTAGVGWTNGSGPACSDANTNTGALPPGPGHPTSTNTYPYCPDGLFQFHHQPFDYYANYAPDTPGRAHLQDELNFDQLAKSSDNKKCNLKDVSFVKPIGEENEHPGYASTHVGSDHLVDLLQMVEGSACAKDTMVVVTYDEFGGQWDHVPPPGQGNNNGPHDVWGPGTRIPALVLAPHLKGDFVVDSTEHDTTSIIATIEHRYGLAPLSSRDAAVPDLSSAFSAKKPKK